MSLDSQVYEFLGVVLSDVGLDGRILFITWRVRFTWLATFEGSWDDPDAVLVV